MSHVSSCLMYHCRFCSWLLLFLLLMMMMMVIVDARKNTLNTPASRSYWIPRVKNVVTYIHTSKYGHCFCVAAPLLHHTATTPNNRYRSTLDLIQIQPPPLVPVERQHSQQQSRRQRQEQEHDKRRRQWGPVTPRASNGKYRTL